MHTHAYTHGIYRPSTFYFKQPSSNPHYSCIHLVLDRDLQSPAVAMDATYTPCKHMDATYATSHAHTFTHTDTNVHTNTLAH